MYYFKHLGRTLIAVGVLVALLNLLLVDLSQSVLTDYFNIHINIERLLRLHSSFLLVAVCIFCLGFNLVTCPCHRERQIRFFFTDTLEKPAPGLLIPRNVFMTTMAISLVLTLSYYIKLMLAFPKNGIFYKEDGILESMTAAGFALAAFFVTKHLISAARRGLSGKGQRWFFFLQAGLSLLFFLICMEEISWGQRIFGWETPEALKSINWQQETNIHNMFNHIWPVLYQLAGICFVIFFSTGWWLYIKRPDSYWLRLFPHPSLAGIAAFIGAVSLVPSHELIEQLASVFAFYYSLRMTYLPVPEKA